ncbi:Hypp5209 [Branchiostoma lanceolatum]|uniref:Hypp5209 protein n=1 Tax=Branchiostoma lanceolatum TaxID=7740 RepID=A0A8K0ADB5_BRALA|nr:Hypp5209 [Branchiostoma lanceolatum]
MGKFLAAALLLLAQLLYVRCVEFVPNLNLHGITQDAWVDMQIPSDYRGQPVYRVVFDLTTPEGTTIQSNVHRQYDEFKTLNKKLPWLAALAGVKPLPAGETANEAGLTEYLQSIVKNKDLRTSRLMDDFLGINWNCSGVGWFKDTASFMTLLTVTRLPDFVPERPNITLANVLSDEYPMECFLYMSAFKHNYLDKQSIPTFMHLFESFTEQMPKFEALPTARVQRNQPDQDVWPPGVTSPIELPYHYVTVPVHFLPGGYVNGGNVRISYNGRTKFNFLKEDILRSWYGKLVGHLKPKTILDVGTGNCFSAFVFGEMFPQSDVIGVDLAAPFIRFCRLWKSHRPGGAPNVKFYQDNGEKLHFPDSTFDVVNFAYVLHEMPAENARRALLEAQRVLKPGGTLNVVEPPYFDNPAERLPYVEFNTWGHHWNTTGDHGPEPYIEEFENTFQLPNHMSNMGLKNITHIPISIFDAIYIAQKP